VSRKQLPLKKRAARARAVAHQERVAWRRARQRGLSAADLVTKQFTDAGTPRRSGTERSPV